MGCTSHRVRFLCLRDTKKPEPKKSHSPRFLGRQRRRPLPAQVLGAKPARPFGPGLRRVSADAAEACFAPRIRRIASVLSFFPSLFNTPPRRGGHRKTSLCGDFRCRDLRLRQARRKLSDIVYTPPCAPPEPRFGG